jgi:hypothetical protein
LRAFAQRQGVFFLVSLAAAFLKLFPSLSTSYFEV